ncbi:MAG TPA: hypothetical protein VNL37_04600 [Candidatus Polarisedimenticolia bacterium]|nr:hypothetical protein [Candidatus Polarisedimenticolia bacterium]
MSRSRVAHRSLVSGWIAALFLVASVLGSGCSTPGGGDTASTAALTFIQDDYAGALAQARERKVPLFIEAWAPW